MKYANELKVGIAIVVSVAMLVLGIRFLEDLPLFHGTTDLETEFDNAGGLVPGNSVRVNGITIGSITGVEINPATNGARISFQVDSDVAISEGSTAALSGFDALGVVLLEVKLGPPDRPAIPNGGFVPGVKKDDLFSTISDRAPVLIERADSVLLGLDETLYQTRNLLANPEGDFLQTLAALRSGMGQLTQLLRTEEGRIAQILTNAEELTGNLNQIADEQGDSLGLAVQNLNDVLGRLDRNLASFESTTATLDAIMGRIDRGEGTLGLLVNDPALYHKLDSTLTGFNALLTDFKQNPKKYLKDMKLVDIF